MSAKSHWRVGKREGQKLFQIKEAPGWRVAHQCETLLEAADWLRAKGVDISLVPVLGAHLGRDGWPSLSEEIAR